MSASHRSHCLLGVSGSIAAYKAVALARLLLARGFDVQVLMTPSAARFVGEATFSALTRRPALTGMFDGPGEPHVEWAAWADILAIVPCTADALARLATGRADDIVTATALCMKKPLLVAPAMHPHMWNAPAVQRNVARLLGDGVRVVGPAVGEVASGDFGMGRMEEPEVICAQIAALAAGEPAESGALAGRRVVVTAGPTVEDLDPVRFISNRSSGKMGFALAAEAARRGAEVTLIAGPVALSTPAGVARINIRSALQLQAALGEHVGNADAVIMTAAVGDYRVHTPSLTKLKRTGPTSLSLVPNPDIIGALGEGRGQATRPVLVAFAVETGADSEIEARAREKLEKKRVDLVVANHADDAFGRDDNRVQLVSASGTELLAQMPKSEVAKRLLQRIEALWAHQRPGAEP